MSRITSSRKATRPSSVSRSGAGSGGGVCVASQVFVSLSSGFPDPMMRARERDPNNPKSTASYRHRGAAVAARGSSQLMRPSVPTCSNSPFFSVASDATFAHTRGGAFDCRGCLRLHGVLLPPRGQRSSPWGYSSPWGCCRPRARASQPGRARATVPTHPFLGLQGLQVTQLRHPV